MLPTSDVDVTDSSFWRRPAKVVLTDGSLQCDFGSGGRYVLQEAYLKTPHAQFLNARSDGAMCAFVKAWGPLELRYDQQGQRQVKFSLAEYHGFRRLFEATAALMLAVGQETGKRECLREHVSATIDYERCHIGPEFSYEGCPSFFDLHFESEEIFAQWVMQAPIREVRRAIDFTIGMSATPPQPTLKVVRQGRRSKVSSHWTFRDLTEALHWMLWYDFEREDPLYRCQECARFFRPETKRLRKFCIGSNCGPKATKREWRRRDLAKKKLAKEARKSEGSTNGIDQAR